MAYNLLKGGFGPPVDGGQMAQAGKFLDALMYFDSVLHKMALKKEKNDG